MKLVVYNNKLVTRVNNGALCPLMYADDIAENYVNNELHFGDWEIILGPPVTNFLNDDSSPINVNTQTIDVDLVPISLTAVWFVEIAFIFNNS